MQTSPPSNEEKYLYAKTNKTPFYASSALSVIFLLCGVFLFSYSDYHFYWYGLYGTLLLVYLGLSFAAGIFSEDFNLEKYMASLYMDAEIERPTIDVFLPSCGEPLDVIKNTIIHSIKAAKNYGPAKIYVLDDSGRNELKVFCRQQDVIYMSRGNNYLRKAGNLRYAFKRTFGEWILILDADFVARDDMLTELVCFTGNNQTAIVQTPQYFRIQNQMSHIEKGAGFVQELFYRLVQVNRDYFGAPVCVGTCALYRRRALEPFGGTAEIDYSEDLHTGFQVMSLGWVVKYFPINLACGECPKTIKSYFTQQYRWCMGSFTLMLNRDFWAAENITWIHRSCFLTGMLYYITTALGIVATVIPSLCILFFIPNLAHWYSVIFSIPSLVVGTIVIALWSKHPFGLYAIESRILAYWAHLFAIIDKLRGNLMPWVPTGAVGKNSRYEVFKWVFISYTTLITVLLFVGVAKNHWRIDVLPMFFVSLFYRGLDLKIAYQLVKGD